MKIGIALMVKNPSNFDIWLKYHIKYLKFSHIYLRIEDTPGLKLILEKYGSKITEEYVNTKNSNKEIYKNQYFSLMERQKKFFTKMIKKARKDKIDYLLHIDDDELFFVSDKFKDAIKFFKYVKNKNPNASQIHFKNYEAIFKKNKKSCFDTDKFIKCKKRKSNSKEPGCKSYINGKSAGRITDNSLVFKGPHVIKGDGERFNVNEKNAKILHYDSCSYNKWYDKFKNLSIKMDDDKKKKIPFVFYKKSLEKLKKCGEDCKKDTYKFWEEIKVDPYYNKDISEYLFILTQNKEFENILQNN